MADPIGRGILVGTILGSGAVFVEGTVTSVALPAIARDMHLGITGLQWVMNGYLLTLSALILLGGALGDRYSRRRVFQLGLIGFALTSLACAIAPNLLTLVIARVLQGASGALVVPNSLALLEETYAGAQLGAAVGHWAAWSAVSAAFGPLVGGSLVDATSWRWVFVCVAPFALAATLTIRGDETDRKHAQGDHPLDIAGATLITLALAGIVGSLIVATDSGFRDAVVVICGVGGVALLVAFLFVERRSAHPLLPLDVFRSRCFSGVNATTVLVYAALNGLFLFLMLELQNSLGYSALAAGASLLPINALMLLVSPLAGRMSDRVGPRVLMVSGALGCAAGMLLFARVHAGASFVGSVLPAAVVFGLGLAVFVAPLTAVAMNALSAERAGLASGVNNAAARLAGLLAVAAIPAAAGMRGGAGADAVSGGFPRAMLICASLCALGAAVSAWTIPGPRRQ